MASSARYINVIVMDACSMPITFVETGCMGLILVSASPSLYIKNLQGAFMNHSSFTMPPTPTDEAVAIAKILGVDEGW